MPYKHRGHEPFRSCSLKQDIFLKTETWLKKSIFKTEWCETIRPLWNEKIGLSRCSADFSNRRFCLCVKNSKSSHIDFCNLLSRQKTIQISQMRKNHITRPPFFQDWAPWKRDNRDSEKPLKNLNFYWNSAKMTSFHKSFPTEIMFSDSTRSVVCENPWSENGLSSTANMLFNLVAGFCSKIILLGDHIEMREEPSPEIWTKEDRAFLHKILESYQCFPVIQRSSGSENPPEWVMALFMLMGEENCV